MAPEAVIIAGAVRARRPQTIGNIGAVVVPFVYLVAVKVPGYNKAISDTPSKGAHPGPTLGQREPNTPPRAIGTWVASKSTHRRAKRAIYSSLLFPQCRNIGPVDNPEHLLGGTH